MTKILHIPSGQILTFKKFGSGNRTTIYEESIYVTESAPPDPKTDAFFEGRKVFPLHTARGFVKSLCNKYNLYRHKGFKEKFKLDITCVEEEFDLISD